MNDGDDVSSMFEFHIYIGLLYHILDSEESEAATMNRNMRAIIMGWMEKREKKNNKFRWPSTNDLCA
jgi:hypothetical protein